MDAKSIPADICSNPSSRNWQTIIRQEGVTIGCTEFTQSVSRSWENSRNCCTSSIWERRNWVRALRSLCIWELCIQRSKGSSYGRSKPARGTSWWNLKTVRVLWLVSKSQRTKAFHNFSLVINCLCHFLPRYLCGSRRIFELLYSTAVLPCLENIVAGVAGAGGGAGAPGGAAARAGNGAMAAMCAFC